MNRDTTITIARAVLNTTGLVAEVTLVWQVFDSKLGVEYRQVTNLGNMSSSVPDQSVKHWLRTFVRDQSQLQSDSYYLIEPPIAVWREIIEGIVRNL